MKKNVMLILPFILILVTANAQQKFQLKGEIENADVPYIYISYNDAQGTRLTDSTRIEKNKFTFNGTISEPTMANLYLYKGPMTSDNANLTSIYLEPKNLTVKLEKDKFGDAIVKGSKTQNDWTKLHADKAPIRSEMEAVSKEYSRLFEQYKAAEKELKALEEKVKTLKEESYDYRENFTHFNNRMKQIDLDFIKKNPESFISPYLLRFMIAGSKLNELEELYGGLSDQVKNSGYGKEIAKEIKEIKGGSPGSKAFEFSSTDINGNPLALTDFSGKYVLLDFWASWCVPCRKGNPHLISLYNKYSSKGFEIIGVSDDDRNPDAWHKAVEQDQIHIWKHVLRGLKHENGKFDRSNSISDQFGISTLPTKILVDPNGIIIGRYGGDGEDDIAMDKKLKEIFESQIHKKDEQQN